MISKFPYIFLTILLYLIYFVGWSTLELQDRGSAFSIHDFINTAVILDLLLFFASHVFLLILIYIYTHIISVSSEYILKKSYTYTYIVTIFILLGSIINFGIYNFPNLEISLVSSQTNIAQSPYIYITLIVILSIFSTSTNIIRKNFAHSIFLALSTLYILSPYITQHPEKIIPTPTTSTSPDVIIIGIDSVSFNQLEENIKDLPNLSALTETGITYTNAYTPLARTFPAWNAIITGNYPATTGVRFNLNEFNNLSLQNNIVRDMNLQGYETVFAQDERRFSNIDERYGYNTVYGPLIGASDFIIPALSDNIISSYFSAAIFGEYLFPNIFNNRVSPKTYSPTSFTNSINKHIKKTSSALFLTIHYCLAHYPYTWSNSSDELGGEEHMHKRALFEIDKQIGSLIKTLKTSKRFDNAIIVLLSDHGEGLGSSPEVLIPESEAFHRLLRGHGNSVLSKDQNNVVLHISTPELRVLNQKKITSKIASLVDLRSTISKLVGLPNPTTDGQDLFDGDTNQAQRNIYIETGIQMELPAANTSESELADMTKHLIKSYYVNDEGLLTITPDFAKDNIMKKQFASISAYQIKIFDPTILENNVLVYDRIAETKDQYSCSVKDNTDCEAIKELACKLLPVSKANQLVQCETN